MLSTEKLAKVKEALATINVAASPTFLESFNADELNERICKIRERAGAAIPLIDEVIAGAEETLACGHHKSLAIRGVETGIVSCELCEAQSSARDAEVMEERYRAERDEWKQRALAAEVECYKLRIENFDLNNKLEGASAALVAAHDEITAARRECAEICEQRAKSYSLSPIRNERVKSTAAKSCAAAILATIKENGAGKNTPDGSDDGVLTQEDMDEDLQSLMDRDMG